MKILEKIKNIHLLGWFLLISAIIYIALLGVKSVWPEFIFTPKLNIIIGWIIFALDVNFFIKGFFEYKNTGDKKMAIFACSFLNAGLFEITHLMHSYDGNLQLTFASLANFSYALPGFVSLSYLTNPIAKDKKFFFANTLAISLIFFGVATFLMTTLVTQELADKIYSLNGTEMLYAGSYFVIAIIYSDIRKSLGLNPVTLFSIGYFLLFLNELTVPTGEYLFSTYRLFVHLEMALAVILIMFGLKDIQIRTEDFSTRLKSYISPFLYLIAIYILFILLSSETFNVLMPKYIQFYFLMFFVVLMFTGTEE